MNSGEVILFVVVLFLLSITVIVDVRCAFLVSLVPTRIVTDLDGEVSDGLLIAALDAPPRSHIPCRGKDWVGQG